VTNLAVAPRARVLAAACFALLGLAIPLSTGLDSTLQAVLVLAWLAALSQDFSNWRRDVVAFRGIAVAALLFALLASSALWSIAAPKTALAGAAKYADLFLVSVLFWAARCAPLNGRPAAKLGLYLFVAAIVLNLTVSYLVANSFFSSIPGLHTFPHYPVGFKLSVTYSIFVSFGAFVALLLAREAQTFAVRAPLVGLAVLCAHNVLVMVIGRTGYLVLGLLLVYLVLTSLRTWKSAAVAFAALAALAVGVYAISPNLQERTQETFQDLRRWQPGTADKTSVGQRIEYATTSLRIISEHPLRGVGAGGFAAAYERATPSALVTRNPHNDYAMIGVQVGVPGVLLLVALYCVLWRDAAGFGSRLHRDLMRGAVLTIAAGGLFNSLLLDHAEGIFFAWIVALAYAGGSARPAPA
jgi:O-antigen ligase